MDLPDAIKKAGQILDEERLKPTVNYLGPSSYAAFAAAASYHPSMDARSVHPLEINENPEESKFKSTNYDLLCALLDQMREQDKPELFASLLSRVSDAASFHHKPGQVLTAGSSAQCSSELPLLSELCVRRGDKKLFFHALRKAFPSPGLTLLLMQLERMIAFDFTLFTDEEYIQLPTSVTRIRQTVAELTKQPKAASTIDSNTRHYVCKEVPELCDSVTEECRKARYLYLKGSLLRGMNLEVNQDKDSVRTFLEKFGFPQLLIDSLNEAERLYRMDSTPFELKSSLGHLRSFLEKLQLQACAAAYKKYGGSLPSSWRSASFYLRTNNILTLKEEEIATALYTLISDAAVHPLIAEREYARLIRNISIEYGLL
jgi:hypothetical protein